MQEYRLYAFDGTGILHAPREFEAVDDANAISAAAKHWLEGRKMELWERDRMVRCWGFPDCPYPQCSQDGGLLQT